MNAAFVSLSASRLNGGLFECMRRLGATLIHEQRVPVTMLALRDEHSAADLPSWESVEAHVFTSKWLGLQASAALDEYLKATPFDLLHTHGLWSYASIAVRRWSKRTGRPYLVSPHGMLDKWALQNSHWKKSLASRAFERRHLAEATCLHALCGPEVDAIRAYGLRSPVCVIPNGVDLPPTSDALSTDSMSDSRRFDHKILLFLGRVHPKKGLPELLRAWAKIAARDRSIAESWRLHIAGWDQGSHTQELQQIVAALNLTPFVEFIGPVFGAAKMAVFRQADAFVLPSLSEGLPMSVLEAWSYRLPVLMTPECNLLEGFAAGAAFRADTNIESLAEALTQLFQSQPSELQSMGERGRALVEERFTWSSAAKSMAQVYRWLVEGGPQPDCVILT